MVGAAVPVAYSASMNSYLSLTGAPLRSTPPLLRGTRFSSAARGSPARAHAAGPARIYAAAARPPRAPCGRLLVGWPGGISPPGSHRSEREPLGSLRSSHLKPLEGARPSPVPEHGPVPSEQAVPPSFHALERA